MGTKTTFRLNGLTIEVEIEKVESTLSLFYYMFTVQHLDNKPSYFKLIVKKKDPLSKVLKQLQDLIDDEEELYQIVVWKNLLEEWYDRSEKEDKLKNY